MFRTRSAILAIGFSSILAGCGGTYENGNVDDSVAPPEFSGPPIDDSNRDLTVADIAGVWELSNEIIFPDGEPEGEEWAEIDEVTVITEDGGYFEYAYKGGSEAVQEGDYGNCYTIRNAGKITKEPDGGFRLLFGSPEFTVSLFTNYDKQDDQLVSALLPGGDCRCDYNVVLMPPSQLTQADLDSMLCEEEK